jgi:hypothetical protein
MYTFYGASNGDRGGGDRRGRQHKRHRSNHRLIRILAAGHRAAHHPAHIVAIMAAVFTSCGTGWSLFVMVLWNIAKAVGAASHGLTRPGRSRERHIKKDDGQQAHQRGEKSTTIWAAAVHRLHSTYVGIISPIDFRARENCRWIVILPGIVAQSTCSPIGSEQGMHPSLLVCRVCSGRFPKRAQPHRSRFKPKAPQVPPPS